MLYVPRILRAPVLHVPYDLHALVPPMPRALVLRVSHTLCQMCPQTLWVLFPYVPLVTCTLRVLYVRRSLFLLLNFHASCFYFSVHFLLATFFGGRGGGFTQIRTKLFASSNLNWRSWLINSMIYLNYLEPNIEPKIILTQLKVNLKLSIIIIKFHSNTVLMKKQQNIQIPLDSKHKENNFSIKWTYLSVCILCQNNY